MKFFQATAFYLLLGLTWAADAGSWALASQSIGDLHVLFHQKNEHNINNYHSLAYESDTVNKRVDFRCISDKLQSATRNLNFTASRHNLVPQLAQTSPQNDAPSLATKPQATRNIQGWTVHIHIKLLTEESKLTERAIELLDAQLAEIVRVVPKSAVAELRKVPLYFSPEYAGKRPVAEFHPDAGWLKKNGRDPVMAKGVEFTNIRIFEAETRRMPNFALHELAHAYHHLVLPHGFDHLGIMAAYQKARDSGKYERVERRDAEGRTHFDRAYALSTPMEYFAETSEAYFSRNDFFPFNREELQRHDPEMFALLKELWQVDPKSKTQEDAMVRQDKRQQLAQAESRLKAIYERGEFSPKGYAASWLRDSSGYVRLENSKDGALELIKYDCASSNRSVLIDEKQLRVPTSKHQLQIRHFLESPTAGEYLLQTAPNTESNGADEYWHINLETGKLQQVKARLGRLSQEDTFSPNGRLLLFRDASNLFIYDLTSQKISPLTTDRSDRTLENGTSVAWSPNSTKIAFVQSDFSKVRNRPTIDTSDPTYPGVKWDRYSRVGEVIATLRIGVIEIAGGQTKWINLPAKSDDCYIHTLEWTENDNDLLVEWVSRGRDSRSFLIYNTKTGATTVPYQESDPAWVDSSFLTNAGLAWIQSGKKFLLMSERDGWRHAHIISRDGTTQKLLTDGKYDITERGPTDENNGWFYFLASPDNATQRYLYRIALDGSKPAERMTPAGLAGTNSYDFSPNGQWAFHTFSTFDSPPTVSLVRVSDHRTMRVLEDNAAIRERAMPWIVRPTEFVQLEIGNNVVMDAWLIKPRDFDALKTYPVFVFVYGEPHGQTVLDDWNGGQRNTMFHHVIADLGYLVVSIDNRGTPAPKGAAWRRAVFGSLGPLSTDEQAAGLIELARTRPYVDLSRVGIWGWSGGGSNTLNALFRKPEVYQLGIAVAPKPQPHLYNAWFQEIYMRTPKENPEGYQKAAAINYAEGLRGNLLIVHGTGETNTHLQITEGLVDRLIELGKPFDYMAYPNRDHGLREGKGTAMHLRMLMVRYLLDHLPSGPQITKPNNFPHPNRNALQTKIP